MTEPVWIEKRAALAFHQRQITEHGGSQGVRDEGLLESALARPLQIFNYEEPTLCRLAAAYAFGLAKNHPFVDGNKRTAFVVSVTFLALNGRELTASPEERYLAFLGLAEGTMTESQMTEWFELHTSATE